MNFHLGKPILVMLVVAAISGAGVLMRPPPPAKGDLTLWVFSESHAKTYRGEARADPSAARPSLVEQFRRKSGRSVDVQLLSVRAECIRLAGMFMSGIQGAVVPDVVEIEIGKMGQYFRPPLDEIGFLPLNDYLKEPVENVNGVREPLIDQIVKARFAPWSKDGVIFGVPHDVHPVTISYRDDLFREAGIDLSAAKTWPDFQQSCLRFQKYWRERGVVNRHAIELPVDANNHIVTMLLQRHVNVIGDEKDSGAIHLADPKVVRTVAFYAALTAGAGDVSASQASGQSGAFVKDLNAGNICAFITADWRVTQLKEFTEKDPATGRPKLEGKMRMMALPVFDPGDSPTSTWGGTMMGIPKACKNPREAWELIKYLYFSRDGIEARRKSTDILPPVIAMWQDEIYQRHDPYFGGQQADLLLTELARQIPARYVTPATSIATGYLAYVLHEARDYINARGVEGLEAFCQKQLDAGAADLKTRIGHGQFEDAADREAR